MKFTKMQGLGNDYVYVNCFEEKIDDPAKLAKEISDRHFGVGSDGLVLIMPSKVADFRMRIFNPDGSEAEMCGNATRCVAKYVYDRKMTHEKKFKMETLAGIIKPEIISAGKTTMVRVDMAEPRLSREKIPMAGPAGKVIGEKLDVYGKTLSVTCVSMGNPHCIIFVDNTDFDGFEALGKKIEDHEAFPKRTNVEFVKVLNKNEVKMRVWERGAGETLACGTGACATAVACVLNNKTGRDIKVHLAGGDLQVNWSEKDNHVYMIGPAEEVFEGEWKK